MKIVHFGAFYTLIEQRLSLQSALCTQCKYWGCVNILTLTRTFSYIKDKEVQTIVIWLSQWWWDILPNRSARLKLLSLCLWKWHWSKFIGVLMGP